MSNRSIALRQAPIRTSDTRATAGPLPHARSARRSDHPDTAASRGAQRRRERGADRRDRHGRCLFRRPARSRARLPGIALVFPLIMLMQQMANSSMGGAIAAAVARAIGAGRDADAAALVVHGLVVATGMAGDLHHGSADRRAGHLPADRRLGRYPRGGARILERAVFRRARLLGAQHADQRRARRGPCGRTGGSLRRRRGAAHRAGAGADVRYRTAARRSASRAPASPRSRRSAHRALRSPGMSRRGGPPSGCRCATCG